MIIRGGNLLPERTPINNARTPPSEATTGLGLRTHPRRPPCRGRTRWPEEPRGGLLEDEVLGPLGQKAVGHHEVAQRVGRRGGEPLGEHLARQEAGVALRGEVLREAT